MSAVSWTLPRPIQPFSAAGKGKGTKDERHLWPEFFRLIRSRRPVVCFGEQVASKAGLGWLDLVSADLESAGYSCGAVDTCAAGFGAPHIRQRLYWVADSDRGRLIERDAESKTLSGSICGSSTNKVADAELYGHDGVQITRGACPSEEEGRLPEPEGRSAVGGFWTDAEWLYCRDDKWRSVEPGTFPLADGPPSRVGRLRAYGNGLVAPQAQAIIEAYMEVRGLR